MFGAEIAYSVGAVAMAVQESKYQELCEAAKAAGGVPPKREEYFGKPMEWELPEQKEQGSKWWTLGLAILIGGIV